MVFHKENAKLIDERLEDGPTFSEEDQDLLTFNRKSHSHKLLSCHVVAFVILLVMGMCLFTRVAYDSYQSTGFEEQSLNRGYYEVEIFQGEDSFKENKPHHSIRDKPPHQMRPRISSVKSSASYDPPPRSEKAKTARYIVHNSDWGSTATISVALNGAPFGKIMSFSDGTIDNSTGIPYFYISVMDPIILNMKANPWASLSLSEAQSDYCKAHNWDPEEPLCSRVSLTGKLVEVGPDEIKFAQTALFSRHPVMKTWPKDHDWHTIKLDIKNVWLQDNYGSANIIPVEDYLKAKL